MLSSMPLNIAHRGARSLAPENTLSAARKAFELGADLWELDVAVTRDGELILFHDDSLVRTTDVKERFPERAPWVFTTFTLDEIRSLDAGSWFGRFDPFGEVRAGAVSPQELASFTGEKVPTLREALAYTDSAGWKVNVELKRLPGDKSGFPVPERVLGLVEELGMDKRRLLLSSAWHPWLRTAKERCPEIRVEALMGILPSDPMDFGDYGFDVYNVRGSRVSDDDIRGLLERGKEVNVYVVNEEEAMRRYAGLGVHGLITDFPQRLRALKL